jgi:predicted enzyme related to lactoylglutathione lyase
MNIGIQSRFHKIATTMAALGIVLCLPGATAADRSTAPGTFVGSDLITEDVEAAAKFYGALFDWDLEKAGDGYSIHHKGRLIASISGIEDDDPEVSRSFWLVGIVVNNLKGSVSAAQKNDAEVVEKPRKVNGGYGSFAVIRDAESAPIMLIQPGKNPVGGTTGPGAWVWAELWTDDIERAAQFYENVVGIAHHDYDRGGELYHVFTSQGEARAGIIEIPEELETVKPGWAPYIGVADLEASVNKVEKLGGRIIFRNTEHPASGAIALILDPTGAGLFLYQIGSHEEASS